MPEAVRLRLASFRNCCSSSPVHSFLGLLAKTAWVWMILFLISCLPRVTSCFSLRPCFAMSSPNVATFKQLSSLRQPLSAVGKKLVPCTQSWCHVRKAAQRTGNMDTCFKLVFVSLQ